jgi:uncharacterized membrane protein YfcA
VLSPFDITTLMALGLCAGALGGMLGIGGSIIMIPVLTLVLHREMALAQAVAMIVNVFVALPAMLQHHRAKAIRWQVVARLLPAGVVFIIIGVEVSNRIDGEILKKCFGVFLLYMIWTNIYELLHNKNDTPLTQQRTGWGLISTIGAVTGFMAGLLGIGGGNVAVPLLQRFGRLPLRQCIATTAAFMCVSSSIGAVRKNLTLPLAESAGHNLGLTVHQSLQLAACLAPTAVLGGLIGGRLTHSLPLSWVRVAFILLLIWASLDMLGIL